MEILRLVKSRRSETGALESKGRLSEFWEDLPIILLNCLVVAVIALLAVLQWPISEEMLFTAAKAFILAFVVQLQKYLRRYGPSPD